MPDGVGPSPLTLLLFLWRWGGSSSRREEGRALGRAIDSAGPRTRPFSSRSSTPSTEPPPPKVQPPAKSLQLIAGVLADFTPAKL